MDQGTAHPMAFRHTFATSVTQDAAVLQEPVATAPAGVPMISVRCDPPRVILEVVGPLDDRGAQLLEEVVGAALETVGQPRRIHVDLVRAHLGAGRPSAVLRRLERAGVTVAGRAVPRSATAVRS